MHNTLQVLFICILIGWLGYLMSTPGCAGTHAQNVEIKQK